MARDYWHHYWISGRPLAHLVSGAMSMLRRAMLLRMLRVLQCLLSFAAIT